MNSQTALGTPQCSNMLPWTWKEERASNDVNVQKSPANTDPMTTERWEAPRQLMISRDLW